MRAGSGKRRRKRRRKKKRGGCDLESAHLDGAGSAGGFGSAAVGTIPAAFFVAPRIATTNFSALVGYSLHPFPDPLPKTDCCKRNASGMAPKLPWREVSFFSPTLTSHCVHWGPTNRKRRVWGVCQVVPFRICSSFTPWAPAALTPLGDVFAAPGRGSPVEVLAAGQGGMPKSYPVREEPSGTAVAVVG